MKRGRLIVFSAPSGSGKSTLIKYLMDNVRGLVFSISATSRAPRGSEKNGVEYYFFSPEEFRKKIEENAFVEYEEVYKDKFYGTLREEVDNRLLKGENVVLDVDVVGALNIKKLYKEDAFLLFIKPPSISELRKRLLKRNTDTIEIIDQRINKAEKELGYADKFDIIIENNDLDKAQSDVVEIVSHCLSEK